MKKGDLVYHEMWGNGMIVQQQGVVNRWLVRFMSPISSIGDSKNTRFCWECDLEVLSESR
jgi:hypothetical protein